MRELAFILVLAVLGGCTALTPVLDEKTGTTLAQRCVDYRVGIEAFKIRRDGGHLSEEESLVLTFTEAWVIANCPKLPE